MDVTKIQEDVRTGAAGMTMAVMQFAAHPKLVKYAEDTDLAALLSSLDDDDPFMLRQMPAIGSIPQYLLVSRSTVLPFGEEGLTKSEGENEMARAMAREQLQVYADKYPFTKKMIDAGLAKAETASCSSCVETRLVHEVARP